MNREAIETARRQIAGTVLRTPLVRLDIPKSSATIYLKLENLQHTNSFKLRGATNAVSALSPARRALGVWTISAGNAGQGVAYAAREAGIPCTVVTIETAPQTKVQRMIALGAAIVKAPFDACWAAMERRTFPGVNGTFVHPFDDDNFIAGNASIGLEIVEDLPGVQTIITAMGGGGLVTGVAAGARSIKPDVNVYCAEPETAAPASVSFENGEASPFPDWQSSFVDGAGGKSVFPRMWERMQGLVDGSIVVSLDETKRAMRVLAEKARVIAEGAGALSVAAALSGRAKGDPIVAVVSGGNIELSTFCEIVNACQ
jgi:threonine dehydratase